MGRKRRGVEDTWRYSNGGLGKRIEKRMVGSLEGELGAWGAYWPAEAQHKTDQPGVEESAELNSLKGNRLPLRGSSPLLKCSPSLAFILFRSAEDRPHSSSTEYPSQKGGRKDTGQEAGKDYHFDMMV